MINYKVVKRVHGGVKGYVIQVPYSYLWGLFKGWDDVYDETENWAGTCRKLVFFKDPADCYRYMNELEGLNKWE